MESFFDTCFAEVEPTLLAFPWEDRERYGNLIAQIYFWVSHSTRLLALGASRLGVGDEALHRRFLTHAAEEKGHHLLALRDLEALGMSIERLPELALTAALYQTQYYRIEYQHPAAFLGYVLLLEGVSVRRGPQMHAAALRHHGPDATTFLQVHTESDPDHFPRALAAVASLPPAQQELVRHNLRHTSDLFGQLVAGIARGAELRS